MKVSLIVSTYNWPQALNLCLKSILNQSVLPSEVIIADDGSGVETKKLIEQYQDNSTIPLIHVWHPDEGFQLAKIRNKAIKTASGEYIVQIDGDLILHPDFLKDHLRSAALGKFVSGSRILLPQNFTNKLLAAGIIPSIKLLLLKGSNRFNGFRIPFLSKFLLSRYKKNKPYYVKGCNMAFWRQDLILVNGYNEEISGWGKEDSEIAIRLINSGINRTFLKFGAVCYHLFHKEASRNRESINDSILNDALVAKRKKCNKGLSLFIEDEAV